MGIIVTLLFVASVALNVWLFRRKSDGGKRRSAHSTLLRGIQNVRELATVRQGFQSIVMYEDSRALLGIALPGTARKFILKYSGMVVCGNDLSEIQISERFAVNRVRMVVPRSKILDIYADMKTIQVYDQKAGLFTSIQLRDQNREIAANLEEVRQDALQSDILRRADENTRLVLTALAASMNMEAEVIFDDQDVKIVRTPSLPEPVSAREEEFAAVSG
ncbi:MAG: DUF4230 domain-containing protein [Synergistaceae bacterium]|nr:DUF4230 domain-containing protein [Synergistaceae bacterium]